MSVEIQSPERPRIAVGPVGLVAGAEIARLQVGYLKDKPVAVATLARLRRGAGKNASALPDLWGLIDLDKLYAPENRALRLESAENAVYAAVTLWCLHQQSRGVEMHEAKGIGVGAAVRKLMGSGEIDEPVRKRFVRVGSAPNFALLTSRLREIVQLLRRDAISLDYALLADQLYRWQQPGGPEKVRREWGRSFHATWSQKPDPNPAATTGSDSNPKEAQ